MANSENEKTSVYYLTATDNDGRQLTSCSQDGSGWTHGDLDAESFVDRDFLIVALDEAVEHGYKDVKVRHVLIGDELSKDDLELLRQEEAAACRMRAREQLIAEKGLSQDDVALIALS